MVMRGFDPVEGMYALRGLIVHTHAKDGIGPGPKRGEVPLGEGEVPWPAYLRGLREIGYDGYLTIEREGGRRPGGRYRDSGEVLEGAVGEVVRRALTPCPLSKTGEGGRDRAGREGPGLRAGYRDGGEVPEGAAGEDVRRVLTPCPLSKTGEGARPAGREGPGLRAGCRDGGGVPEGGVGEGVRRVLTPLLPLQDWRGGRDRAGASAPAQQDDR